MKQELVKIQTKDNIELTGMLYSSNNTKKIVVHVHGLAGNFYENSFVDFQAKSYTENGYSYFAFNNRGNGYFTELVKKENGKMSYPMGGCSFEIFEDCYLDIQATVDYVKKLGYSEIILQGHSFGCGKVIYYYSKINDNDIKNIILLAPCDMVKLRKDELDNEYDKYIEKANEMVLKGMGSNLINYPGFPPFDLTANTFLSVYTKDCNNDIFRYRENNYISKILKNIKVPVLVQIGENDKYALSEDKNVIIDYFNNNIDNVSINFIKDSNHGYYTKEQIMCDNCINWLE